LVSFSDDLRGASRYLSGRLNKAVDMAKEAAKKRISIAKKDDVR